MTAVMGRGGKRTDGLRRPLVGTRQVVYSNPYQQVYRVGLDFGSHAKDLYVTDYGVRAAVVAEGPAGILLIRQYRYLIDRVSWEIPGGKANADEPPLEAARRECLEETGIDCASLHPLLVFHPGLDTLHNPTHLFYTRDPRESAPAPAHPGEATSREWVELGRCLEMIGGRMIVDSLSIIGLLAYANMSRLAIHAG